jgi:hypothetical protein
MTDDPVADVLAVFDVFETGLAWHCMCAVARLDVPDRLSKRAPGGAAAGSGGGRP